MIYFVDSDAADFGDGSQTRPFRKIQQAADIAVAGDEIVVAPGVYRECVNPRNGGTEEKPIIYRSREMKAAHITGAEIAESWELYDGDVYVTRISNSIFEGYNPFTTMVSGDWFIAYMKAHTGDVFLDGKSMYEVSNLDKVKNPEVYKASWNQDFSVYTWYTEQDFSKNETVIYANFHGKNPNKENVEISVRRNCFMPSEKGRNYITLSGFVVSKAATQWAPPTAFQDGMVSPHWSKGWIIEDCEIFESKCSGISLGKYYQKGNDNKWLKEKYKDGTQTQRECVCIALNEGWSKDTVGSHTIRRCDIHDCGQTGIVGHLGGIFSVIEENHIHHINNKQNLAGAEIGGIKMHAAIDVVYRKNHIHHCTRGVWLDWQAQGTRVTQNFFHDNCIPDSRNENAESVQGCAEDLFIEVSHGPTLVDNNIFLSDRAMKLPTQGVAIVHNLIAGGFSAVKVGTNNGTPSIPSPRYTPYHVPHSTAITNFMTILHGDCKIYNNIFIQQKIRPFLKRIMDESKENDWDDGNIIAGTIAFEDFPTFDEWKGKFEGYVGMGSVTTDRYYDKLPIWASGNLYFSGAKPMSSEKDAFVDLKNIVHVGCVEKDGRTIFETNVYDFIPETKHKILSTSDIPMAFEPEQLYENTDGTSITFDTDFLGMSRVGKTISGPFADKNCPCHEFCVNGKV